MLYKRLIIRITLQLVALRVYLAEKGKWTICSISPHNRLDKEGKYETFPESVPTHLILIGDHNAHNSLWRSKKKQSEAGVCYNFFR